jgi:hypothetical protein
VTTAAATTVAATTVAAAWMAESGGRAARWTAAALAAPVVAGVFAGATTWATRVDPLHPNGASATDGAGTLTTPAPSPAAIGDPAIVALRRQLAAQQLAMNRLADQIAAVRAKATALAKQNGASGSGATTTRYASSSGGSAVSSSRSSTSHSSASNNPAPAPAPSTHGSTGASGSG